MTNLDCPIQDVGDLKQKVAERGNWIFTITGRRYFPTSPLPEDVDVVDIAHALSQLARYTGHTRRPISVAQHSVLCSRLVSPEFALEALLHDAAEAYIGDISRPVKQWLRSRDGSWDLMEDLNARAIARRFRLQYPWPPEIAQADNLALALEVRDQHCTEFHRLLEERGIHAPAVFGIGNKPWTPSQAKRQFLHEFKRLRRDLG